MYGNDERIALGLITRRLDDPEPVLRFVRNAQQHGHRLERVIVAYSHSVDERVVTALRDEIRVDILRAHSSSYDLKERLVEAGLSPSNAEKLLEVPSWPCEAEVPYGAYRNVVLIHALLEGIDYLAFVDTDVFPRILTAYHDGKASWREIDFFGGHLKHLTRPDVTATSSDYSGYFIIPPMVFDGLEALLVGLNKLESLDFMQASPEHHCLSFGPQQPVSAAPTEKFLGGNLALSLDKPGRLAPFFSTTYAVEGRCVLGRGEDTLLGQTVVRSPGDALDVGLPIFHNTFGDFPNMPDINRKPMRDRFYRACLGWIGRNPFLIWHRLRHGWLEGDFDAIMQSQRAALLDGGPKAAVFLDDQRFASLAEALDASLEALPEMIDRYRRLMDGWAALLELLEGRTTGEDAVKVA